MASPMTDSLSIIKYVYSTGLLIVSLVWIVTLIWTENTIFSRDIINPALSLVVMVASLMWLNMVEGGHCALVGLCGGGDGGVDTDLFVDTHPITYQCCSTAHNQNTTLDRYLLGRQFMVVLLIFVIHLCGAPMEIMNDDSPMVWDGIPEMVWGCGIFAMVLIITMAGQLHAQVNASHCRLDYINHPLALLTIHVALAIEASGLLHSCYLVQMILEWFSGKPFITEFPSLPRTAIQKSFFWGRIVLSLGILFVSLAVTLSALSNGQTTMTMSERIPNGVAIGFFLVCLCMVGLLEGMPIAFLAMSKLDKSELAGDHYPPMAKRTCHVLFQQNNTSNGINLPRFMVGRQVCVTFLFLVLAQMTTLKIEIGVDKNIFEVSDSVQIFLNTGLVGAFLATILGSLVWQLVAFVFPMTFVSNPLVYSLLQLCLLVESTGICGCAWILAMWHKRMAGFQNDNVYVEILEDGVVPKDDNHEEDDNGVQCLFQMGTNMFLVPTRVAQHGRVVLMSNDHFWIDDNTLASTTTNTTTTTTSLSVVELDALKTQNKKDIVGTALEQTIIITMGDIESSLSISDAEEALDDDC